MKHSFIFTLFLCTATHSQAWHDPAQGAYEYLYLCAPGVMASETQFAKLTPYFQASTGQTIKGSRGIEVLPSTLKAQNLAEISLRRTGTQEALSSLLKLSPVIPLSAFLQSDHSPNFISLCARIGIFGVAAYALWRPLILGISALQNTYFGITVEGSPTGNYYVQHHAINPLKINLAQDDDLNIYQERLSAELTNLSQTGKPIKAILYGISRGSATVFSTFAQLDAEGKSEDIGAVICEGVFDSVPSIAVQGPLIQRIKIGALMALQDITCFKKDGVSPISLVSGIQNKEKPIALITSKKDGEVPYKNTLILYNALRAHGLKNVHILVLENVGHNHYSVGPEKEKYQAFMHAFYKKYGLPYKEDFAAQGQEYLAQSQP